MTKKIHRIASRIFRHSLPIIKLLLWFEIRFLRFLVQGIHAYFPKKHCSKTVVLVRCDGLGDFLISLSTLSPMCDHFHALGYKIALVVSPKQRVLAENCPLFDILIEGDNSLSWKHWRRRLQTFQKIYKLNAEIAVNALMGYEHDVFSDYCIALSGAKTKAGLLSTFPDNPRYSPTWNYLRNRRWYSFYNCHQQFNNQATIWENEQALANLVCGKLLPQTEYNLDYLSLPKNPVSGKYYIVAPGAISRVPWPGERFAELVNKIYELCPDLMPVLTGIESEKPLGEKLIQYLKHPEHCINLIGKCSLLEAVTVMKNAQFTINNDTGTLHLAHILKVHSYCIVQLTNFGQHVPLPNYTKTTFFYQKLPCIACRRPCDHLSNGLPLCLDLITPDFVWNTMKEIGRLK